MLQKRQNFGQIEEAELIKQQIACIKKSTDRELIIKSKFNNYADKMLRHLVVSQYFNFQLIAGILRNAFRYDDIEFTPKTCRQRWYQLHRDREVQLQVREEVKENKRLQSIIAFTNPYSLYTTEQLIQNLEKGQKEETQNPSTFAFDLLPEVPQNGYNIFKHKFRKIDNFQQYNRRMAQMQKALQSAQNSGSNVKDKPMFYAPDYNSLAFQVLQQEFTQQKMMELMSHKIEIEKLDRQFEAQIQISQTKYKSKIQEQIKKNLKREQYQIEQNWDQYQSD